MLAGVFLSIGALSGPLSAAIPMEGRVLEVLPDARALRIELTEASGPLSGGDVLDFRAGVGDLEIGYAGRRIRAEAVRYNDTWHVERVFPLEGAGAKAMGDVNRRLHDATASMRRREYVHEGEYIPNFAMIDQTGEFFQIRSLRGKAFVLNFIFTRCTVPEMCPASSTRMAELQDAAREAGLEDLHFVTVTFDPEFDSPGILRQYARGYGIEPENFHLLTGSKETVDDLLRQFGILTRDEDGTINHTMATLLVDPNGRVAFRKEGSTWTVEAFLQAATKLLKQSNDDI